MAACREHATEWLLAFAQLRLLPSDHSELTAIEAAFSSSKSSESSSMLLAGMLLAHGVWMSDGVADTLPLPDFSIEFTYLIDLDPALATGLTTAGVITSHSPHLQCHDPELKAPTTVGAARLLIWSTHFDSMFSSRFDSLPMQLDANEFFDASVLETLPLSWPPDHVFCGDETSVVTTAHGVVVPRETELTLLPALADLVQLSLASLEVCMIADAPPSDRDDGQEAPPFSSVVQPPAMSIVLDPGTHRMYRLCFSSTRWTPGCTLRHATAPPTPAAVSGIIIGTLAIGCPSYDDACRSILRSVWWFVDVDSSSSVILDDFIVVSPPQIAFCDDPLHHALYTEAVSRVGVRARKLFLSERYKSLSKLILFCCGVTGGAAFECVRDMPRSAADTVAAPADLSEPAVHVSLLAAGVLHRGLASKGEPPTAVVCALVMGARQLLLAGAANRSACGLRLEKVLRHGNGDVSAVAQIDFATLPLETTEPSFMSLRDTTARHLGSFPILLSAYGRSYAKASALAAERVIIKAGLPLPSKDYEARFLMALAHEGLTGGVPRLISHSLTLLGGTAVGLIVTTHNGERTLGDVKGPADISIACYHTLLVLKRLHTAGFTHGDIKPSNVVVGENVADITIVDWETGRQHQGLQPLYNKSTTAYEAPPCVSLLPHRDLFSLAWSTHVLLEGEAGRPIATDVSYFPTLTTNSCKCAAIIGYASPPSTLSPAVSPETAIALPLASSSADSDGLGWLRSLCHELAPFCREY